MAIVGIRGRPLEAAQVLWQRALELVDAPEQDERFAGVIEVLRAARHDPTILEHALALGRTQLHGEIDTIRVAQAVRTLERAVEFLGVRPARHAAAMPGARLVARRRREP